MGRREQFERHRLRCRQGQTTVNTTSNPTANFVGSNTSSTQTVN